MEVLTTQGPALPADGDLGDLLAPLDARSFLRDRLGRRPFVIRGAARRFASVFGWQDLNRILETSRVDPARMHLVDPAGRKTLAACAEAVPQLASRGPAARFVPGRLHEALRSGATLVVDGAEELHHPLRDVCATVERALRCPVQANLYANLGGGPPGFSTHWDDHDVLVLQVEGSKHWDIHRPTADHPVGVLSNPPVPEAGCDPYWSGELTDGDLLSLPRGWWHNVSPVAGPSVHLTLGARLPSAGDLLRRLMAHLATEHAVLRHDLPRFAEPVDSARWFDELRQTLVKAVETPGVLEELAAVLDRGPSARPAMALPDGPAADARPDAW